MPTLQPMPSSHSSRSERWALPLLAVASVWGCASEVVPNYGDPAQVAGGVGGGSTTINSGGGGGTTTSATCEVDAECGGLSYADDIFPILNRDGITGCANTPGGPLGCHNEGKGNLTLAVDDAPGHYSALLAYVLDDPAGPYIVPCDPDGSKIFCNLKVSDGDDPSPTCGTTMPLAKANAPTTAEILLIKDWIACGAPDN